MNELPKPRTFDTYQGPQFGYTVADVEAIVAALAAQPGSVPDERLLRQLLAIRVAGPTLYADDGELQDNSVHPFIDFKRDSASEIERKLIERGMANAWKSIGQFAAPTEAKPAQDAVDAEKLDADDTAKLEQIAEEFADCNETMVDLPELMRFARMGYLECTNFIVTPKGDAAIRAAISAKKGQP